MLGKGLQHLKSDLKTEQSGGNKHRTQLASSVLNVTEHYIYLPSFFAYSVSLTIARSRYRGTIVGLLAH